MSTTTTTEIEILGSRYELETDDERHEWMFRRLWEPFVTTKTASTPIPIRFEGWGPDATFRLADNNPVNAQTPWRCAIESRNQLIADAFDRAEGLIDIHAAALEREGRGLLLVGPLSAGKTTFALELMERGFKLLSDDMAPIDLRSGQILPLPKPLVIKTNSWGSMKHHWEPIPEWLPEPRGLFVVPATQLPRSQRIERIEALVFLAWEEGAGVSIEEITPAQALTRCARNMRRVTPETLHLVSRLGRGAATLALTHPSARVAIGPLLDHLESARLRNST